MHSLTTAVVRLLRSNVVDVLPGRPGARTSAMTTSYPEDPDGDVLDAMAVSGVDMTKPLPIEFVIDTPGEDAAKAIELDLVAAGFEATAEFEDAEPEEEIEAGWVVTVDVEMVPEYQPILDLQAKLQTFADAHGAKVDGWGALIDEDILDDSED